MKQYKIPSPQYTAELTESQDGGYVFSIYQYPYGNLVKTNRNGNILWQKWCGDKGKFNNGFSLATNNNGFFIGASTNMYHSDSNETYPYFVKLNVCGNVEKKIILISDSSYSLFDFVEDNLKNKFILIKRIPSGSYLLKMDSVYKIEWKKQCIGNCYNLKLGMDNSIYLYNSIYLQDSVGGTETLYPYIEKLSNETGQTFWRKCTNQTEMYSGDIVDLKEISQNTLIAHVLDRTNGYRARTYWINADNGTIIKNQLTLDTAYDAGNANIFQVAPNRMVQIVGVDSPAMKNGRKTYMHLTLMDTSGNIIKTKSYSYPDYKFMMMDAILTSEKKILVSGWTYTINGAGWQDVEDVALYRFTTDLERDSFETDTNTYDYGCNKAITSDTISLADADTIRIDHIGFTSVADYRAPETYHSEMQVYPNPVHDFATIVFSGKPVQISNLRILDMMGRTLQTIQVSDWNMSYQISTIGLASGTYMIQATNQYQMVLGSEKIVVF